MFSCFSNSSILFASARSRLGKFIATKKSWTLPDVRPKDPLIERNPAFPVQMRIAAAAEHRQRNEDRRTNPEGHTKPAIYGHSSRPGDEKGKDRFTFSRRGASKASIRRRAKQMKFGAWNY